MARLYTSRTPERLNPLEVNSKSNWEYIAATGNAMQRYLATFKSVSQRTLLTMASRDPAPFVRLSAIEQIWNPDYTDFLVYLARDSNNSIAKRAMKQLARIRNEEEARDPGYSLLTLGRRDADPSEITLDDLFYHSSEKPPISI